MWFLYRSHFIFLFLTHGAGTHVWLHWTGEPLISCTPGFWTTTGTASIFSSAKATYGCALLLTPHPSPCLPARIPFLSVFSLCLRLCLSYTHFCALDAHSFVFVFKIWVSLYKHFECFVLHVLCWAESWPPEEVRILRPGTSAGSLCKKDLCCMITSTILRLPWIIAWALPAVTVQFSRSVVSDSLWICGLQHARLPCPSLTPGVYSNSCALSWWYHPTISSSVIRFSSCLQPFPASGSFPVSRFFPSGGWSIGASASASVLPMSIQDWFPLGLTGWMSSQSKGLSRVFSNTTVHKHQFFGTQLSLWSNSHTHTWLLEKATTVKSFDWTDLCRQSNVSAF